MTINNLPSVCGFSEAHRLMETLNDVIVEQVTSLTSEMVASQLDLSLNVTFDRQVASIPHELNFTFENATIHIHE